MSVGIAQSPYRPEGKGWTSRPEVYLVRLPSRLLVAARIGLILGVAGLPVLFVLMAVKA